MRLVAVGSNVIAHRAIASAAVGRPTSLSSVLYADVSGSIRLELRVLGPSGPAVVSESESVSIVYYGWHSSLISPILNNCLC